MKIYLILESLVFASKSILVNGMYAVVKSAMLKLMNIITLARPPTVLFSLFNIQIITFG